jgi:hypothetical protein
MMLDGAEECQLSGPIGELVPFRLCVRSGREHPSHPGTPHSRPQTCRGLSLSGTNTMVCEVGRSEPTPFPCGPARPVGRRSWRRGGHLPDHG